MFTSDQIERLTGHEPALAHERIAYVFDLLGCANQRHSAQRMMSTDLRMNLADDLLLYTDKITMRYSIECRVPFLDLDLVRFVEALPCRFRVGMFGGKRLHKRFAERILPASSRPPEEEGISVAHAEAGSAPATRSGKFFWSAGRHSLPGSMSTK